MSLDPVSLLQTYCPRSQLTRQAHAWRVPACRTHSHLHTRRGVGQSGLRRSDRVPSRCSPVSLPSLLLVSLKSNPPINIGSVIASVLQARRSWSVSHSFAGLVVSRVRRRRRWSGAHGRVARTRARVGSDRFKKEEREAAPSSAGEQVRSNGLRALGVAIVPFLRRRVGLRLCASLEEEERVCLICDRRRAAV